MTIKYSTSAEAQVHAGVPTVAECTKASFSLLKVGNLIFTKKWERLQCCVQMYVGKAKNKNVFAVFLDSMYPREQ